uniref:WD_REPEATS_REGION domain-containing protein n=1 Tax=Panagrellus redivivus TaxID=6233 RepID=A0A7E4VKK3_PANRE
MSKPSRKRAYKTEEEELTKKLFPSKNVLPSDDSESEDDETYEDVKPETKSTAVWQDDDDETELISTKFTLNSGLKREKDRAIGQISGKEYEKRLREKYTKGVAISNAPNWAKSDEERKLEADSDSDEESALNDLYALTRSTGKITASSDNLPRTYLSANKQKDITVGHNGDGPIVHVKFHPYRPVLMTCGQRSTKISLFEVCESHDDVTLKKNNNFLQDVSFPNFEVGSCEFYNGGESIFVGSVKKPFFYTYNLETGSTTEISRPRGLPKYNYGRFSISDDGELIAFLGSGADVFVYELKTMVLIHTFAASSRVVAVKFAPGDRMTLFGYAANATVYLWDLYSPSKQQFFYDDGAVGPRSLAVSKNGQFVACGTDTAIVNVYLRSAIEKLESNGGTLKPLYTVDNLTTQIGDMAFNHDSQLLAITSAVKKMAYRVVHMRSGTVFKNFPPKQEALEREFITCVDFSPHSAYMAYGTAAGHCRLYRLNGFHQY